MKITFNLIVKKIAFAVMYVLIGYFIDTSMKFLGFIPDTGGHGIGVFSILVISIAVCALSYNLRIIKIKKQNKTMESEEYAVFNDTVKTKIRFILKSLDFKIEAILSGIICISYWLLSFITVAAKHGIAHVFSIPMNIILLFVGIVVMPMYMAGLDVFVWYKALNKCYKKKAY